MTEGTSTPEQAQGELFGSIQKPDKRLSPKKSSAHKADPSRHAPEKLAASRFLSIEQVAKRYGVGKSTVWRWVASDKNFPAPIKLSKGTSRWLEQQLLDFENTAFLKTSGKKKKTGKGETGEPVAGSPA